MIKVAVVDDEIEDRFTMQTFFHNLQKEIDEKIEVAVFSDGKSLLDAYDSSFDLISLDIDLGDQDGIELARKIRKKDGKVILIFVTNMAQMAIRGYEVRALDFLVKPVNYYSFSMKLRSALNIIKRKKSQMITITTGSDVYRLSTNDIYYVEVNGHYLCYHTSEGTIRQKASMKEVEEKLCNFSFKRCNNCYLVNLKYVNRVTKEQIRVAEDWLAVSRPRKKEFLRALADYMGGIGEL